LRDRVSVHQALADFQPHVVSHQAAQVSVAVSVRRPHFDAAVNVLGGLNLLDACIEVGVVRVVFASTGGAIYGEVPEGELASHTRTSASPASPYAINKLTFERYLSCYRQQAGLESVVLRYANVYGPRQSPHGEAGVVAIFAKRLLTDEPIKVYGMRQAGDGGCVRDYVFVDDVVGANVAALTELPDAATLDVCTGVPTTTGALLSMIEKSTGRTARELAQVAPRPGDLQRSLLDATELTRLTGAPVPIDAGIERTVAWFRERTL
jgi:UDP-glucose 4-epimerase